jgi:hypothetical protein
MSNDRSGSSATQASTASETNGWDVLRALLVLAALVILTIALVKHYDQDEKKAAAILGIAAPVLAAIVGVTLGYATGNTKGKATGEAQGRKKIAQHVREVLDRPEPEGPADDASRLRDLRARIETVADVA